MNAALVLSFLYKCVEVFCEYFKDLEEESVRDNFVVIYELFDEMMDFGYPQTTESRILQEYITQEGHRLEIAPRPPMAVTNAVSWRSDGIKYRKNEVFLDVIESVNMLANASGTVLRSEIIGSIRMRVVLSGMPELRLGLNDKVIFEQASAGARGSRNGKGVELEDVKFHQCVRLSRFEAERTISFIPPDGEFELMSYRLTTQVCLLLCCPKLSHFYVAREYFVPLSLKKIHSAFSLVQLFQYAIRRASGFKSTTATLIYRPSALLALGIFERQESRKVLDEHVRPF
ncbi:adaptor complexe medium subunit family protein [Cooperia oncophora]